VVFPPITAFFVLPINRSALDRGFVPDAEAAARLKQKEHDVFLLLFAYSFGSAFLAGYSMASRGRSWFHMFSLALAVSLTIYATLEIEYPRRGLIRLADTDKTLIELRNSMS
jgi:hypothetical protein